MTTPGLPDSPHMPPCSPTRPFSRTHRTYFFLCCEKGGFSIELIQTAKLLFLLFSNVDLVAVALCGCLPGGCQVCAAVPRQGWRWWWLGETGDEEETLPCVLLLKLTHMCSHRLSLCYQITSFFGGWGGLKDGVQEKKAKKVEVRF